MYDYYKFSEIRKSIQEIDEINPQRANELFDSIEIDFSLGIYKLKPSINGNFELQNPYSWFLDKILSKGKNYLGRKRNLGNRMGWGKGRDISPSPSIKLLVILRDI